MLIFSAMLKGFDESSDLKLSRDEKIGYVVPPSLYGSLNDENRNIWNFIF